VTGFDWLTYLLAAVTTLSLLALVDGRMLRRWHHRRYRYLRRVR
jgi:hypothetical protein